MYQIDFHKPMKVHFMGIGGISMSGLACVLAGEGFTITGSDAKRSDLTAKLENAGMRIRYPQAAGNIEPDTGLVVYTAAIHPDNPEYQDAVSRGIPMMSRADLLGEIMANYRDSVAVAGTHGKTTTTSMLAHITLAASMDPTISVGGILPAIGGNIRVGQSETFVTEACEYTNSFLSLYPRIGIILNVDADHLDFFKDLDDIRRSFRRFAEQIPAEGVLIIDGSIDRLDEITEGLSCRIVTIGHPGSTYEPRALTFDSLGFGEFDLYKQTADGDAEAALLGHFHLRVPGMHNVLNAIAAIAAADILGAAPESIQAGLETFTGTNRRFEHKGTFQGAAVIDDYAHHPTEIRATLQAAQGYAHRRLICVFQPHTYSRTKSLLPEFAEALTLADEVVLAQIYAARETDTLGVSSAMLGELICEKGGHAVSFATFEEIEKYLKETVGENDLLITMGAGDVYVIGENLLST